MINPLYCLITDRDSDHLNEAFNNEITSFLTIDDYYHMAGYDILTESILFMYIEEWKVVRIIEFCINHDILIEYQKVDNVIDFISSDEKYLEVFSDDHNKAIINYYIMETFSVDDILDRMNQNKNNTSFSLSEIEKTVLGIRQF